MAGDDDAVLGEIRMYAGSVAPPGWMFCGSDTYLDPAEYPDLFSLIGNTYGGNGQDSFALPDLRQRAPVHNGAGPDLQPRELGSYFGAESVALVEAQLPHHPHDLHSTDQVGDSATPTNGVWASSSKQEKNYTGDTPSQFMAPECTTAAGGGQPHDNMPPFATIAFIICVNGVYPSQ